MSEASSNPNTFNICLGHKPPPAGFEQHYDLMVGPRMLDVPGRFMLLPDSLHGPHGSVLSEYSQLLWLARNLSDLVGDMRYVRVFQYRRLCLSVDMDDIGPAAPNQPWCRAVSPASLAAFADRIAPEFSRTVDGELFNRRVDYVGIGLLGQYATSHVLDDLLAFTRYLLREGVLDEPAAVAFLQEPTLIPACNVGVFSVETFAWMYALLDRAAGFMHSDQFVVREGYQRRSMGFLLERLQSFLIRLRLGAGLSEGRFGYNYIIVPDESDGTVVQTQ